jgi:dTDP-4-amino-4,6-dideoxygalactose transaminase
VHLIDRRVPFLDLSLHHEPLMGELRAAFERVVDSSEYILGEEVERFEEEFAACSEAKFCVGVSSGTTALTLGLMAAGIGRGDEVLVPAHTFIASGLAVLHAGATPVLCDVEEATGLLDVDHAGSLVTDRTVAIMPVHLYGQCCDMDRVTALADKHGLVVIEDAAHAHGATHRGRRAGSLGTLAAFSFYPSKNLGAFGDGGAICTSDSGIAERARQLRHLGQRNKGEHIRVGFNERLDGLQAALLGVKLPHLDRWNESRRHAAAVYRRALAGKAQLLEERPESPCVYHLFPVRLPDRDGVAARLGEAGVDTVVHYSPALHHQPPLAQPAFVRDDLPRATAWAAEELSLPMSPEIDEAAIGRVVEVFDSVLARA